MADKLPLGFINDDDELRRNGSGRREGKHEGEREPSAGLSVCIREAQSIPGTAGLRRGGAPWTDSGTTIQSFKNPRKLKKAKELSISTTDIF